MKPKKVFYAVLNMGLGHATRSLPVIRECLIKGWNVLIGSNGRSLAFLKKELPNGEFVQTPDYGLKYSKGRGMMAILALQTPRLLKKIAEEQQFCQKITNRFSPDLIISDHCYGMFHQNIPCYFLTHQVHFALPGGWGLLSPLAARVNFYFHNKFTKVIIPDLPDGNNGLISGRLGRLPKSKKNYCQAGLLSSIRLQQENDPLDLLVSVSGPEPQRSIFEKIVLAQIEKLPGKKVVALGKSESSNMPIDTPSLKVYSHIPRNEMERLFNRANLIISRPGYSTIMELVELGKKALLVPTPGQTEQIYLAKYLASNKWFYSINQEKLELNRDIEIALKYPGFHYPSATKITLANIFDNILTE